MQLSPARRVPACVCPPITCLPACLAPCPSPHCFHSALLQGPPCASQRQTKHGCVAGGTVPCGEQQSLREHSPGGLHGWPWFVTSRCVRPPRPSLPSVSLVCTVGSWRCPGHCQGRLGERGLSLRFSACGMEQTRVQWDSRGRVGCGRPSCHTWTNLRPSALKSKTADRGSQLRGCRRCHPLCISPHGALSSEVGSVSPDFSRSQRCHITTTMLPVCGPARALPHFLPVTLGAEEQCPYRRGD